MKTSWIIGIVMFYLLIFGCEVFATGGTSLGGTTSSNVTNVVTTNQTAFMNPNFQESTNVFTNAWATATGVASYLTLLVKVLFLWCPTIFSEYGLWVWWFICFPTDCAMIAAIIFIVRGTPSN